MLARVARRVGREFRNRFSPPDWLRKKRRVDREFDALHGVDTGGYTYLKSLHIKSANWRDGTSHIAADPDEFHSAMAALDIDFSRFTFIDLGSGKGRALMLARQYGFKQLIGVEFSAELVEIAKRNGIDTICADAAEYELPNEPTLLLLYNPFGGETMKRVAQHTRASLEKNPRELIVLYLNPFHLEAWDGFTVVKRESNFAVLRMQPGHVGPSG